MTIRIALALTLLAVPAWAKGKPARRPAPVEVIKPHPVPAPETKSEIKPAAAKAPPKPKVYNFSGLDVEGKLKTPQLLYFFDRVKLELDTTAEPKRSFIRELEESAADKGL